MINIFIMSIICYKATMHIMFLGHICCLVFVEIITISKIYFAIVHIFIGYAFFVSCVSVYLHICICVPILYLHCLTKCLLRYLQIDLRYIWPTRPQGGHTLGLHRQTHQGSGRIKIFNKVAKVLLAN